MGLSPRSTPCTRRSPVGAADTDPLLTSARHRRCHEFERLRATKRRARFVPTTCQSRLMSHLVGGTLTPALLNNRSRRLSARKAFERRAPA